MMTPEEFWTKTFIAAVGGMCADTRVSKRDTVVKWAEELADASLERARARGVVGDQPKSPYR
jgi:hypothetical protein